MIEPYIFLIVFFGYFISLVFYFVNFELQKESLFTWGKQTVSVTLFLHFIFILGLLSQKNRLPAMVFLEYTAPFFVLLLAGEPERREHLRHRLGAVLRNHADRVARQIGHALFQRQRKMPRLLLGPLAAEKAIDQHGRMVWIVARVPGTPIHIRGGLIGWRPRLWNLIHASIVTGTRGFLC